MIVTSSLTALGADVEVAPLPRVIKPDGTRDPAPTSSATKAQNPLETVERIIKNSTTVGDKLAMIDTGIETRKTQDAILKDIQSLIEPQENPPPKSGQNQDMNNDKKPNDKNDKNDMPPQNDMPPNGGMDRPPMGGNSDQQKARKPRQKNDDQPRESGGQPMTGNANQSPNKQPPPSSQNASAGRKPDPLNKGDSPPPVPSLPPEETMKKDVWGYLPDKLRQQAMQYYKQEFVPRYEKLLEHYYSSLSEKKKK